jgi:hypothetical protein
MVRLGSPIRPASEIATRLADLLCSSEFAENVPWEDGQNQRIADWLYLSAGIQNVSLERAVLIPGFGYCRGADEYELQRDRALSPCVTELSRFLFTWGGLETTILAINVVGSQKEGRKIDKASQYIHATYGDCPIAGFEEVLAALQEATEPWIPRRPIKDPIVTPIEFGCAAMGLQLVYTWRNDLAHGSLNLPGPDDANATLNAIANCRTLTLMSQQMLLSAALRGHDFQICDDELEDRSVRDVLDNLHLHEQD